MKKSIGIDVKPPSKTCEDPKCGWHGKISLRGKVLKGNVSSVKSHHTAVVEWHHHHFVQKYERYERSKSKVVTHNPPCIHAKDGDKVVLMECRPLSKTKHFVIVGFADQRS